MTAPQSPLTREAFLASADHTLLAPDATAAELDAFIASAAQLGVARVCVSPTRIPKGSRGLEIVTVVGFPTGVHTAETKAFEAGRAIAAGAHEIDMVINPGLVADGDWPAVEAEIRAVREATAGRVLKVILETAALADQEIIAGCRAAGFAGADFVKTSTGFHAAGGATLHAVRLMAETVGDRLGVKASGGIRTAAMAREMWSAGATRFGVSATEAIVVGWDSSEEGTHTGY
ncbi:MAG: deoxyribose-phosphate aldolase [Leucobacter sp.]